MLTNFVAPAANVNRLSTETTFVIEREIGKQYFLFVEYVGDYQQHSGPELSLQLRRRLSHHQPADRFPHRHRPQRQRAGLYLWSRLLVPI